MHSVINCNKFTALFYMLTSY